MKKLKKRNNKSVSKFQLGGPTLWLNRNSGKSYVTLELARALGLPLYADINDPQSNAAFDYRISDSTGMNRPSTIGGLVVNPQTTYVEFDPSLGAIMNTSGSSIILPEDNILLTPIDNTWVFHPRVGWLQPNTDSGEITNPDTELTRNFLGNTLGWEQAYRVPQQTVSNMGDATASAMVQSAVGTLGGEVLGTAAKYAPRVMSFVTKAPRTTAVAGQLGLGTAAGYALNKDEIGEYLSNIDDDITDEDFLNMGGEEAIPDMLKWLGEHGYKVIKSGNTKNPAEIKRSYFIHPNAKYVVGPQGFFYYEDIPFGAAALFKGLRNKKWFPWVLGTGYVIGKGARIAYYNSPAAKAGKLVNYLLSKGYITIRNNQPSYNVQTNQTGNPQIMDTVSNDQMQDSAATTVPYNEGQTGSEQDSINLDYYGWENDTAQ